MQAFLLQLAAESLKSPFKNPPFGNAVPQSLVQNSSVMHVEKDVDGDRATFILWARDPDLGHPAADGRVRGSSDICCFRVYSRSENKKYETVHSLPLSASANNFADLSICLIIQFQFPFSWWTI